MIKAYILLNIGSYLSYIFAGSSREVLVSSMFFTGTTLAYVYYYQKEKNEEILFTTIQRKHRSTKSTANRS